MTALSVAVVKTVYSGLIAGSQSWSASLWATVGIPLATPSSVEMNTVATACGGAFSTFWTTAHAYATSDTDYRKCSAYFYASGSTLVASAGEFLIGSPVSGSGAVNMPTTAAIVCSLKSDHAGRSGRGRFYLPATGMTLQANHQLSSGVATSISAALKVFLDSLNALTWSGPNINDLRVVVASHATGEAYNVTACSVDTKPDHQSRRAAKIVPLSRAVNTVTP